MKIEKIFLIVACMVTVQISCSTPQEERASSSPSETSSIIPIAVIGSGTAGLSAALFTAREKYPTVVFQGPKPGGTLKDTSLVENWPGILSQRGDQIIKTLETQVTNFGGILLPSAVARVDFSAWPYTLYTDDGKTFQALTVIISTGAVPTKLDIPGEKKYWGKGVSACTLCDAALTKDQEVVIIGGGTTALEHAIHLVPYAKKITVAAPKNNFTAKPALVQKIKKHDNIRCLFQCEPLEIQGDAQSISAIVLKNNQTGSSQSIATQWVFIALSQEPNSSLFPTLKRDARGIITVDCQSQATSVPGVFAAGRVANARYKLGAIASGEGIKAGLDAISYLEAQGYDLDRFEKMKDKIFRPESAPSKRKTMAKQKELLSIGNQEELKTLLEDSDGPVVLEFFSPGCPHCKMMQPVMQELVTELPDITLAQSNIDNAQDLAQKFNVHGVPTFIIFKGSTEQRRTSGSMRKEKLHDFIQKN